MDGGQQEGIPRAREMGQQTCHVLQNGEVHRQRLLLAFENLKPPDDPSKCWNEICGWLPNTKVQYRKPEKSKQNNNSGHRPISGKKLRQSNPREHFQFIHYSDPRKYIEQYRRLHTCGGPLEKLTQRYSHGGRETEIYYVPFDHHHPTSTTVNASGKSQSGQCPKCARLEPPTLQSKFPNYYLPYSPRETNITFEIQTRPSVSQYKAVYNTNTGITYDVPSDHASQSTQNGSSGSTSRESSAETPEKYSFHNGPVVALPKPRLYVATSGTTATTNSSNATSLSNSRSTSRQSPPSQNGFSIDRSLGKVTSITGHTQTESDRGPYDMTATGYNIMTVDRKEQRTPPLDRTTADAPTRPKSQGNPLPIAVGVKVQQAPRAQSARPYQRPHTAASVSTSSRPLTRQKTWSASSSTASNRDFQQRRVDLGGGHAPSICEGTFLEHLEKYTYHQRCLRAAEEDASDTLRPPSRFTPVPLVRPSSIKKVLPQHSDVLSRSQELEILRVAQGRSKPLRLEDPNPYDMWEADRQRTEERARDRQESRGRRYKKTLVPDVKGLSRVFCAKGGGWKTYANGRENKCRPEVSIVPPERWQMSSEHLRLSELFCETNTDQVQERWEQSLNQMNPHHKVRRRPKKSPDEALESICEYEWT